MKKLPGWLLTLLCLAIVPIADTLVGCKPMTDGRATDQLATDQLAAKRQAADKQAADKQAANKQVADKQAADKQAADKQKAVNRALDKLTARYHASGISGSDKSAARLANEVAANPAAYGFKDSGGNQIIIDNASGATVSTGTQWTRGPEGKELVLTIHFEHGKRVSANWGGY